MARLQIRATVRSANRQKWIEEFRDTVAAFCGQIAAATQVREMLFTEGRVRISAGGEMLQQFERLIVTATKIRLLVDPVDVEHQRMVTAIDELLVLFAAAPNGDDIQGRVKEMALQTAGMSLAVIRHEWARVLHGI